MCKQMRMNEQRLNEELARSNAERSVNWNNRSMRRKNPDAWEAAVRAEMNRAAMRDS